MPLLGEQMDSISLLILVLAICVGIGLLLALIGKGLIDKQEDKNAKKTKS